MNYFKKTTYLLAAVIVSIVPLFTQSAYALSTKAEESSISIEQLPQNIKNLIDVQDDSIDDGVNIGENKYDLSSVDSDGNTVKNVYATPIKFEDKSGNLEFIDTSFEKLNFAKRAISRYDYKNKANEFEVLFSKTAKSGLEMNGDFTMAVENEAAVEEAVIDSDENKDGRIKYQNAFGDNTYLEYININSGIKENIVLKKNIGKNRFEFNWTSKTHILVLSEDGTSINVVKKNAPEKTDYVISPLYVYDSYTSDLCKKADDDNIILQENNNTVNELSEQDIQKTDIFERIDTPTTQEVLVQDEIISNDELNDETATVSNSGIEESQGTDSDMRTDNKATETTSTQLEKQQELLTTQTEIKALTNSLKNNNSKHYTDNCRYEVEKISDGNYRITAVVPKEFLDSDNTVYPVTIDPSVTASTSTSNIDDTYVNESSPNTNYGSYNYMCFGYNGGRRWGYVKFKTLPTINWVSRISTADLTLKFRTGQTTSSQGKMWAVKSKNWSENAITWNTRISGDSAALYKKTSDHHNCGYYEFDTTQLVKDWYYGVCPNYGVVFTYSNQTYNDYNSVYSSEDSAANAPKLRIVYVNVNKSSFTNAAQATNNSSYNRAAAAQYAANYAEYESTNIRDTPEYYSTKNSASGYLGDGEGNNCTNFVSQCLHAGGMIFLGTSSTREEISTWRYDELFLLYYASYTWGGATSFAKHWGHTPGGEGMQRAYQTIIYQNPVSAIYDWDCIVANVHEGDVIQIADGNGNLLHSMMIYYVNSNQKEVWYAQHTNNGKYGLADLLNRYYISDNKSLYKIIIHRIKP